MPKQTNAKTPTEAQPTVRAVVANTGDAIVASDDLLTETEPTEAEPPVTELAESTTGGTTDAIIPAEGQAVTPAAPTSLITDPYDYSQTAVSITYTFLPDDGHPEGRTVLVSLHTTGQKPLFSQVPLREQSAALKDAVAELQERYKVYLPEHKLQVEQEAAAQAAAAKEASTARKTTTTAPKVPTQHAQAIAGGADTVVVSEKPLSLFG